MLNALASLPLFPVHPVPHGAPSSQQRSTQNSPRGFYWRVGVDMGGVKASAQEPGSGKFRSPLQGTQPRGGGRLSWGSGEGSFELLLHFVVSLRKPVPAGRDGQGVTSVSSPLGGAQILPPHLPFSLPPPQEGAQLRLWLRLRICGIERSPGLGFPGRPEPFEVRRLHPAQL